MDNPAEVNDDGPKKSSPDKESDHILTGIQSDETTPGAKGSGICWRLYSQFIGPVNRWKSRRQHGLINESEPGFSRREFLQRNTTSEDGESQVWMIKRMYANYLDDDAMVMELNRRYEKWYK